MIECSAVSESNAAVDGRGMLSESDTRSGTRSSMASGSGVGAIAERRGNVRLWTCRVWCARCVVSAECAVMSLGHVSITS